MVECIDHHLCRNVLLFHKVIFAMFSGSFTCSVTLTASYLAKGIARNPQMVKEWLISRSSP